jgi:hypothetical protein
MRKQWILLSVFIGLVSAVLLMTNVNTTYAQGCTDPTGAPVACPDDDGDGLPNDVDTCPAEPGPRENGGCPVIVDSDGDGNGNGLNDDVDVCPTEAGTTENNGCPATTPEPITLNPMPTSGECVLSTATTSRVNIRATPNLEADIVGSIALNELIVIELALITAEDELWYFIGSGWVSSTAVRLGGDCSTLPTRDLSIVSFDPTGQINIGGAIQLSPDGTATMQTREHVLLARQVGVPLTQTSFELPQELELCTYENNCQTIGVDELPAPQDLDILYCQESIISDEPDCFVLEASINPETDLGMDILWCPDGNDDPQSPCVTIDTASTVPQIPVVGTEILCNEEGPCVQLDLPTPAQEDLDILYCQPSVITGELECVELTQSAMNTMLDLDILWCPGMDPSTGSGEPPIYTEDCVVLSTSSTQATDDDHKEWINLIGFSEPIAEAPAKDYLWCDFSDPEDPRCLIDLTATVIDPDGLVACDPTPGSLMCAYLPEPTEEQTPQSSLPTTQVCEVTTDETDMPITVCYEVEFEGENCTLTNPEAGVYVETCETGITASINPLLGELPTSVTPGNDGTKAETTRE